jgi:tRNA pseudouridine55 synthase
MTDERGAPQLPRCGITTEDTHGKGPAPKRRRRPDLCGILNVDKPSGVTSHDVVVAIRRASGQRRVGHAGTLDPLATGVLLVCIGKATRVSEYLMASPKTYRAEIHLGISTTTDDREGEVTLTQPVDLSLERLEETLARFVGRIQQVPPVYSAIKRKGQPLYRLARQGQTPTVPPREVEIYRLRLIRWDPPFLYVEVECGPGTYIRALARDVGDALGCGAHLASLRRTKSGRFCIEHAVSLYEAEKALASGTATKWVHPMDTGLAHLPAVHLDAEAARRLTMGQGVPHDSQGDATSSARESIRARAYGPGNQFIAIVHQDHITAMWRPDKVFVDPEQIAPAERSDSDDACSMR